MSQTNLRSTACDITCCSIKHLSGYAIWHSGQQYNVEPSNAFVSRISPGFGRGFFSYIYENEWNYFDPAYKIYIIP